MNPLHSPGPDQRYSLDNTEDPPPLLLEPSSVEIHGESSRLYQGGAEFAELPFALSKYLQKSSRQVGQNSAALASVSCILVDEYITQVRLRQ